MTTGAEAAHAMLRLTCAPGVGPVLGRRLIQAFGGVENVLRADEHHLRQVKGVGEAKARAIAAGLRDSKAAADAEMARAERLRADVIPCTDPRFPPLLSAIDDAPLLLFVRGTIDPRRHPYTLAVVGSRSCTAYGMEQAERFSAVLAQAGLTIVSGGARGIDTAAHRAALRVNGQTIAVLGCGLSHCYPPENAELFEKIIAQGGAVVSELPIDTPPVAENFPGRNRIISGLSLGTLVIEAPRGSGSAITARLAVEQGREVMAIPGRIDSPASAGAHDLIRRGEAGLVAEPGDVLDTLEQAAHHVFSGTHAARFQMAGAAEAGLFEQRQRGATDGAEGNSDGRDARPTKEARSIRTARSPGDAHPNGGKRPLGAPGGGIESLSPVQRTIIEALGEPRTFDELCRATGLDAGVVRSEVTMLEIRKTIERQGSRLSRRRSG